MMPPLDRKPLDLQTYCLRNGANIMLPGARKQGQPATRISRIQSAQSSHATLGLGKGRPRWPAAESAVGAGKQKCAAGLGGHLQRHVQHTPIAHGGRLAERESPCAKQKGQDCHTRATPPGYSVSAALRRRNFAANALAGSEPGCRTRENRSASANDCWFA